MTRKGRSSASDTLRRMSSRWSQCPWGKPRPYGQNRAPPQPTTPFINAAPCHGAPSRRALRIALPPATPPTGKRALLDAPLRGNRCRHDYTVGAIHESPVTQVTIPTQAGWMVSADKIPPRFPPRGEGTPVRTLGGMRGRYFGKLPVIAPSSVTAFTGRATFPPQGEGYARFFLIVSFLHPHRNISAPKPVDIRDVENSVENVENLCTGCVGGGCAFVIFCVMVKRNRLFCSFLGRAAAAGLPNREKYDTISCNCAMYSHTTTGRFP